MWIELFCALLIIIIVSTVFYISYRNEKLNLKTDDRLEKLVKQINNAQYYEYQFDTKQDENIQNIDKNVTELKKTIDKVQNNLSFIQNNTPLTADLQNKIETENIQSTRLSTQQLTVGNDDSTINFGDKWKFNTNPATATIDQFDDNNGKLSNYIWLSDGTVGVNNNKLKLSNTWTGHPDKANDQAEIANDSYGFKKLMIVGNKSSGDGVRKVGIWDKLDVHGNLSVDSDIRSKSINVNNINVNNGACTLDQNGLAKVNQLQLGQKFRLSGIGDPYFNDGWLRLLDKDAKGYFGGIAASQFWTANGGVVSGSDARMKKNIGNLSEHDINNVINLVPKEYSYIDDPKNRRQFGFVAQDLEKVYPNLVETGANGMKSVRYQDIIPILVGKIKHLEEKINSK